MKIRFIVNDKAVSKAKAKEIVGADRLKRMIADATEGFKQDPYQQQSWMIRDGCLTIEFV